MPGPETGNRGAGDTQVAALTPPPAQAAHVSQPGRQRVLGVRAGITGPVPPAAHFTAPALARWPYPGTSPGELIAYATAHRILVCGGRWPRATGAQTPHDPAAAAFSRRDSAWLAGWGRVPRRSSRALAHLAGIRARPLRIRRRHLNAAKITPASPRSTRHGKACAC